MRVALVLALLAGCATPDLRWYRDGSTQKEFNVDSGQCRAQAFSVPLGSALQQIIVFEGCMEGKGWYKAPAR